MGSHSSKDDKEVKKNSRDVRLLVPDESKNMHTIVVPKELLMQHCHLLRNMIENGTVKKLKKFVLKDVTVIGVLKTLQCVEHGTMSFESVDEIAETLKVAQTYKIEGIEEKCIRHLNESLNTSNVCEVYEFANERDMSDLVYKCLKIIDEETEQVVHHKNFLQSKKATVEDILKRNSLKVNSEYKLFEAVIRWGKAEVRRLGHDSDNSFQLKQLLRPVLTYVRFQSMTPNEMADSTVNEFLASLSTTQIQDMKFGITSKHSQEVMLSKSSLNINSQPRTYLNHYVHNLEVFDSNQSSIVNGETFPLTIEVLKGKVFLLGMNLAFKTFSSRMNATCLYAMLTATNLRSGEQRKVRGTFLDATNDTSLSFNHPLFLKDNDQAEVTLHVKMAGNVCPLTRKNDVDVVVPENKDIAMKILQNASANNTLRCLFKGVIYFY